jgi:hypothetical protein
MAPTGKPIVKIIRIRMMVEEHTYRRFRLNFLRIHRQAVMGNERRYFYDYYMLCCGPLPLVPNASTIPTSGRGIRPPTAACHQVDFRRCGPRQRRVALAGRRRDGAIIRDGNPLENHLAHVRHRLVPSLRQQPGRRSGTQDAGALLGPRRPRIRTPCRFAQRSRHHAVRSMLQPTFRALPIIRSSQR